MNKLSPLHTFTLFAVTCLLLPAAHGQASSPLMGYWREPEGSVIQVQPCGTEVCLRLVAISRSAPAQVDAHNPDSSLRTRAICGLTIGRGFHATGPAHAEGGKLYDPKSGKTYNGSMTAVGDRLDLRGYVGVKLFGRTETWIRTTPVEGGCVPRH